MPHHTQMGRRSHLPIRLRVGFDGLAQRHLADLDSVGRHCATGLHKLGARYPVPLTTDAGALLLHPDQPIPGAARAVTGTAIWTVGKRKTPGISSNARWTSTLRAGIANRPRSSTSSSTRAKSLCRTRNCTSGSFVTMAGGVNRAARCRILRRTTESSAAIWGRTQKRT